jgi:hypothetical protein
MLNIPLDGTRVWSYGLPSPLLVLAATATVVEEVTDSDVDTFDVPRTRAGDSLPTAEDVATASTKDVVNENTVPSAKLTRATSGVSVVVVVIILPPPEAEGGVPGTTIVETPS